MAAHAAPGAVRALGYLGLQARDLSRWSLMAEEVLGVTCRPVDDALRLRLDEREWRVEVAAGEKDDLAYVGWEVRDASDLQILAEKLKGAGRHVDSVGVDEALSRGVEGLLRVSDPEGNTLEFFYGARCAARPWISPLGRRFVTGDLGLGHVVLMCGNYADTYSFYVAELGFGVSDVIYVGGTRVAFLHCNRRHHSLALVDRASDHDLQHWMLEVAGVDDVGEAFAAARVLGMAQSELGRHTNDQMLSFYVLAPGGYTIEYGCGGRLIDADAHTSVQYTKTSRWGHDDLVPSRG